MPDYEKLGVFYLGRKYDQATRKTEPDYVLYDAKDLTTHAVCVGMTGSGKTGLCVALLEEAAIDGIPSIIVDPKGDLGNLALTFPNLKPEDFRPWVEESEATRRGLSADEFAAQTAEAWKKGLASWDQQPDRIQRLRDAVDLAIYTPGSSAGIPLTVLRSFAAPPAAVLADSDTLRAQISATVSGLLALVGIEVDPIRSREHILLSNLLERAWREGRDLDLGNLLREIQTPPFDKVGFIDLETFFPTKERTALVMQLNNVLASPSFSGWLEGEPLDIQRLLYTPEGKPRMSILSIAHLSDSERMFFVTILLGEMLAWTRQQSGTSSLRALFYMDEVFGYFPPVANPPSKLPMLTLLKQALAFGVGIVLATQNPVDLDYKGLSNTGTWLLGRLQTERDKARVLEGLEGASAQAGAKFDRQQMEATLAGLGNRVFLMNNVHEDAPVVFQSRWALSFLRGPLTRSHIQTLMQPRKAALAASATSAGPSGSTSRPASAFTANAAGARPVVPPEANERFLESRGKPPAGGKLVYRPALLGLARVHFVDAKTATDVWQNLVALAPLDGQVFETVWDDAETIDAALAEPAERPAADATFAPLPAQASNAKSFATWQKGMTAAVYRNQTLKLWSCSSLKASSTAGESEADFRIRIQHQAREQRDLAVEKLRAKYAPKMTTLQDQIRRAEEKVAREESQASQQKMSTMLSFGTTVLGALLGRKTISRTSLSGAASAIRGVSKSTKESGDVGRAQENVGAIKQKLDKLQQETEEQIAELEAVYQTDSLQLDEVVIRPRKSDITPQLVAIAWVPWHIDTTGAAERAL